MRDFPVKLASTSASAGIYTAKHTTTWLQTCNYQQQQQQLLFNIRAVSDTSL